MTPFRESIVQMAKDGRTPAEIARLLGTTRQTISVILSAERKKDPRIPRFRPGKRKASQ